MADEGHKLTDKLLKDLEKDIAKEYRTATREMQAKLTAYLEKTEAQRQVQEGLLKDGKITQQDYDDWVYRHTMMGNRWKEMREVLAEDMTHANEIAKGMIMKEMPDVYALNGNYGTYQVEHGGEIDTGFTLYNHEAAEYLLGDQRQLMPKPSPRKAAQIAANKDMQWNMQKIQSAVLQGVMQGESPYKVAERLQRVGQMNYNSAVRYARTMTTSAQNAGRYEAYRRATDLGVDLTIEWQATLDHRTRHDHRLMHGQRTVIDKPFHTPDGFTIYYPADCTGESTAPQREIWNCRCTLRPWVKGFEGDTIKSSPKMGDMSYDEWLDAKERFDTKADRDQFDEYKKILGKDFPNRFADYQELKYNNPKEWDYTKKLAGYLRRYPNSSKALYDVGQELKAAGIDKGLILPPVQKNAYILPSGSRDPYHIMERMMQRNITDDDLRSYIQNAKCMFSQWGGKRQLFVGEEGMCVVEKHDDDWIYKTAWNKSDFDEESDIILRALKDAGL